MQRLFAFVALSIGLFTASTAYAGNNDLVLRRLGECTLQDVNGRQTCVAVTPDTAGFESLTRDLGLIFSPKGMSPADTLGEAGFEVAFELNMNFIDSSAAYWQAAVEDQSPDTLMMVSQFHVTKGLPFSFEVGGVLSHLFESEMWAVGAELTWAFHEDYFYPVPQLGIRGFVNHVVGSTDLNLTTAGFDAIVDVPIGISGVVNLTPYLGYNLTAVFASSRLLDATPDDLSPPVEGTDGAATVKPEFVFDDTSNTYHRVLGGFRVRFAAVNLTLETVYAEQVQTVGLKVGLDF